MAQRHLTANKHTLVCPHFTVSKKVIAETVFICLNAWLYICTTKFQPGLSASPLAEGTHLQLPTRDLPVCGMNLFAVPTRPSAKNCVFCLALAMQWKPSASFPCALCSSHSAGETPFPIAAVQELPLQWIRNVWIAMKGEPWNLELLLNI